MFDPLAVALVVAFNNAMKVDRGIVDKQKVIRKRELYNETPDEEETSIEEIEVEDLLEVSSEVEKEYDEADINKDGIVTEEEKKKFYETEGWKNSYDGNPYYTHPWFDWNKRERWINDRSAIKFWMNNRGGSQAQFEKIQEQYPTDFTKKTY